jgi:glycosyltransferase involved in cell wall biosynthesis
VDITFLGDAIVPPLTGIGRYASELVRRLPRQAEIASVALLTKGGWRDFESLTRRTDAGPTAIGSAVRPGVTTTQFLQQAAAHLPGAARLIECARDIAYGWHLRRPSNRQRALLHGPNYYAPASDLPTVVTVHDLSTVLYPETHPPIRVARVARMLDRVRRQDFEVITDATSTAKELVSVLGLAPARIHIVPLGVGAPFRPVPIQRHDLVLERYALATGRYCLSVGTAEPRKNLIRLLAAYASLPAELRRSCPIALAGAQGWSDQSLRREVDAGRRDGWVKDLGYVPLADLPTLYSGAKLFTYVSVHEGFGLSIAEAMACGAPVLTSSVSSMPEVAGGAAMLVDPTDTDAIAKALVSALTDDAWRATSAAKGLARAADLSWDRTVAETVAVYRSAMARH